jgi:hypothetical protein
MEKTTIIMIVSAVLSLVNIGALMTYYSVIRGSANPNLSQKEVKNYNEEAMRFGFQMSIDGGKTWMNKEEACEYQRQNPENNLIGGMAYKNSDGTSTFVSECGDVEVVRTE